MIQFETNETNTNNEKKLGFLSLKNAGDSAQVRFYYDSVGALAADRFAIHTSERTTKTGKTFYAKYACLRDKYDKKEVCPVCAFGQSASRKVFLRVIHYVEQPDGTYVPEAKIWERGDDYALQVKNLLESFDSAKDFVNTLYTITRNKTGTETSYTIAEQKKSAIIKACPLPTTNLFADYDLEKALINHKTKEEFETMVANQEFKKSEKKDDKATGTVTAEATPNRDYNQPAPSVAPDTASSTATSEDDLPF